MVDVALTPDERARFLGSLSSDAEFREEVRRRILTEELLSMPDALVRLMGAVGQLSQDVRAGFGSLKREFGSLKREFGSLKTDFESLKTELRSEMKSLETGLRSEMGKLNERLGEMAEDGADAVLVAALKLKGYRVLGEAAPVEMGSGEVDVAIAVEDVSGPKTAVVEAKFRLRASHVRTYSRRLQSDGWKEAMREAGFSPPWLPYIYGSRVYLDALSEAGEVGIGVLAPAGERLPPAAVA